MTMVEEFIEVGMLRSLYYFSLHNSEPVAAMQSIVDRSKRN